MSAGAGILVAMRYSLQALFLALQFGARCCEFLLLLRVDLGVCEIEPLNSFHNRGRDNEPSKPLVVSWHYEPRRVFRCGGANSFFVCVHIVAPELTFVHVRSRELPVLLGSIEALHKALLLFFVRHLQEELEDNDSLTSEVALEMRDIGEPLVPYALIYKRLGHLLFLQDRL